MITGKKGNLHIKRAISNIAIMYDEYLEDVNLSWKAKGLLAYFLSQPEEWELTLTHLKTVCTDGMSSINAGIAELVNLGYIRRTRLKNEKGRFEGYQYEVSGKAIFFPVC